MERILLAGATGRLGREISSVALEKNISIIPLLRNDITNISTIIRQHKDNGANKIILIDVSLPEGTETLSDDILNNLSAAELTAFIVGTTGHTAELAKKLHAISSNASVIVSSNFSRGIFFFEELLKAKTSSGISVSQLARQLGFDLALWESHHTLKKDAPSGTAKTLAHAAQIESERIASTRVGSIVGEHSLFLSQGAEELRLTHVAHSRRLFAEGAVDLCERIFMRGLDKRHFTMSEAINSLIKS